MPRQTAFISNVTQFHLLIPSSDTDRTVLSAKYDRGYLKVTTSTENAPQPRRPGTLGDDLPYALYVSDTGRLCAFSTLRLVTYGVAWPHPDATPGIFTPWVIQLIAAGTSVCPGRSFSMSVGNIIKMRCESDSNAAMDHPCFSFAKGQTITPVHLPRTLPDTKSRAVESKKRRQSEGIGIWCKGLSHGDERPKTVAEPIRHLQNLCRGFVPLCDVCRRSVGPIGMTVRMKLAPTGLSSGTLSSTVIKHVEGKAAGTSFKFLPEVLRRYEKMATDRLIGGLAVCALFHFYLDSYTATADVLALGAVFGLPSVPLWLTRTQCVHMMARVLGDDELGALVSFKQSMTTLPFFGTDDAVRMFSFGFGVATGDDAKKSKLRTTRHVFVVRPKKASHPTKIYGFKELRLPVYALAAVFIEPPGGDTRAWYSSTLFRIGLGLSRTNVHRSRGLLIEIVCGSKATARTFSSTFYHRITVSETASRSMLVTMHVSDPGELLTFATLDRILRDAMRTAEGRGRAAESVVVKLVIHACIERAWLGVPVRGVSGSEVVIKTLNDRIGQASPRDKVCGQTDRPWRTDRRIMTGSTLMMLASLRDLFPTSVMLKMDDERPLHPDRPVVAASPAERKRASTFIGAFMKAIVLTKTPIAELVSGSPCLKGAEWDVERFGRCLSEFDKAVPSCLARYVGFGRLIGRASVITDDLVEGEVLPSSDSRSRSFAEVISQCKRRRTTPSPREPDDDSETERLTAPCVDGTATRFVPFSKHKEPEAPSLSQSFRKEYTSTPPLFEDDK